MSSHDEELARFRAEVDQAKEGLKEVASGAWTLYAELVAQGFAADQALQLTTAWLTTLLSSGMESDG